MNTKNNPFQRWQFLAPLIVFIAVSGLLYFFRELITEIILMPILYVLWVVDLALQIFGQQCIWILAFNTAAIFAGCIVGRDHGPILLHVRR